MKCLCGAIRSPRKTGDRAFGPLVPFTKKARRAYAVLATGETALYANLILQKGVVQNGPGGRGRLNGKHSAYALCRGASPCI